MKREGLYYFLSLDTEDDGMGNVKLAALTGDYLLKGKTMHISRVYRGDDEIAEMCKLLASPHISHTYLVGFNIAYDLNNIHRWWAPDRLENRSKFITTKNKQGIKALELSMNWFQGINLKTLSKKWLKNEDPYIDIHSYQHPRIEEACMSHARSVYLIANKIQLLLQKIGMTVYLTASSTAMHFFMKHCKFDLAERDINGYLIADGKQITNHWLKYLQDLAYRGGRTEVFRLGRTWHVYYYDVVSMYPAVMRDCIYPNTGKLVREVTAGEALDLTKEGFVKARVFVPDMHIPPLLVQREGKLIAPIGTIVDYFTYPELRYLLELGGKILDVEIGYEFESAPGLFDSYIDACWDLKKDKETKEVGKLLMNGLSGKFGQKIFEGGTYFKAVKSGEERRADFDIEHSFFLDGIEYQYEYVSGIYGFPVTSHPLISAYICAHARIKLHKIMNVVGQENIIYCDTDSVMSIKELPPEYVGSERGMWELKQEGYVDILAPKKYKFKKKGTCGWELHANGIPMRTMTEFFADPAGVHYTSAPIKYHTAMRLGQKLNKWVLVRKQWQGINNKRIFDSKGNSNPIKLDEISDEGNED